MAGSSYTIVVWLHVTCISHFYYHFNLLFYAIIFLSHSAYNKQYKFHTHYHKKLFIYSDCESSSFKNLFKRFCKFMLFFVSSFANKKLRNGLIKIIDHFLSSYITLYGTLCFLIIKKRFKWCYSYPFYVLTNACKIIIDVVFHSLSHDKQFQIFSFHHTVFYIRNIWFVVTSALNDNPLQLFLLTSIWKVALFVIWRRVRGMVFHLFYYY